MKKYKTILLFALSIIASATAFGTHGTWYTGANFTNSSRSNFFQFTVNNKIYMGSGSNTVGSTTTFYKDLWEFDPVTNSWSQKADFGGNERVGAVGFEINNKGYAGMGADFFSTYKDIWEFDPFANSWTFKSVCPGSPRVYAVSLGLSGSGLIGLGRLFTPSGQTVLFNDLWDFEPLTNAWTQKGNFPGAMRYGASTFRAGNYGYFACGQSGGTLTDDIWQYDPGNDTWLLKSHHPGGSRLNPASFVIQDTIYVGLGRQQPGVSTFTFLTDFWAYEPLSDVWIQMSDFMGNGRFRSGYAAIDSIGYVFMGSDSSVNFNDMFSFNPRIETLTGISENSLHNLSVYPTVSSDIVYLQGLNPSLKQIISLYHSNGQLLRKYNVLNAEKLEISLSDYKSGTYLLEVRANEAQKVFKLIHP